MLGKQLENTKISSKESLGYYELRKHRPWFDKKMLRIIRSKETSYITVVTGSK
jgi:hypothetical protein